MPKLKKGPPDATALARRRAETLNMRIDPKLKYLAVLAALEQQRTLSSFIGWAIRRALTCEAVSESDQPRRTYGAASDSRTPLWNEALWDVDECDRFFLRATRRPDLLRTQEQRFWKSFSENAALTGAIDLKSFREFWSSPHVDTTHLTALSEED